MYHWSEKSERKRYPWVMCRRNTISKSPTQEVQGQHERLFVGLRGVDGQPRQVKPMVLFREEVHLDLPSGLKHGVMQILRERDIDDRVFLSVQDEQRRQSPDLHFQGKSASAPSTVEIDDRLDLGC
jgi:hypothetical protein